MGSTREKGKIPHTEWPKIVARYNGGETIASIGRAYGCTAPAIRYIVKRSGTLKGESGGKRTSSRLTPSRQHESQLDALSASDGGGVLPLAVARAGRPVGRQVLGAELRRRVSGDVASFLVALDQAVLGGSVEAIADLQEATDRLMRSTARTRLELERLLSSYEGAGAEDGVWDKAGSASQHDA